VCSTTPLDVCKLVRDGQGYIYGELSKSDYTYANIAPFYTCVKRLLLALENMMELSIIIGFETDSIRLGMFYSL
jgi:hypothetical protein